MINQIPKNVPDRILLVSSIVWLTGAFLFTFGINVPGRLVLGPALLLIVAVMFVSARARTLAATPVFTLMIRMGSLGVLAAGTAAGILFYYNYSNHDRGDIACYLSAFYTTQGILPGYQVFTKYLLLALHSEFLCIPVNWLFQIFPYPWFLLLLQSAMVTSSWVLLRRWLMRKTSDTANTELLSFAFACSPACLVPLLMGFHGVSTALPFLVLAGTSFADRRWKHFAVSLIFLLLSKEVFILTAAGFGIVSIIQRRPIRWCLFPLVVGTVYGFFLKFFYFPHMLGDSTYFFSSLFKGPTQIPAVLFSRQSLVYLMFLLLIGGSAAAFRNAYILLAVPPVMLGLLLDERFTLVNLHYIIEPVFWVFFAGITAITAKKQASQNIFVRAIALCSIMLLLSAFQRHGLPLYTHHLYESSYRKALSCIPEHATVTMGAPLADHLWKAGSVRWAQYDPDSCLTMDWALIRKNNSPQWCTPQEFENVQNVASNLPAAGFALVWEDTAMAVYTKQQPEQR